MEVRFIGQGYNLNIGTSVAQELITAFANTDYTQFKCLVAFASRSGVSAIASHIRNSHITNYRVVVGIDQKGTSKEALDELLNWGIEVFIYYTRQQIIFHPKIYMFEGTNKALIIIGSNNLTQRGLVGNIEGSVAIEINKQTDGVGLISQISNYFEPLLMNRTDNNLKVLTPELIGRLVASRKVPTESQRRALYTKEESTMADISEGEIDTLEGLFTTTPLQASPTGFSVPRVAAQTRSLPITPQVVRTEGQTTDIFSGEVIDEDGFDWSFDNTDNVLVAQIGGPARWQQTNFPKPIFENFFGALAGNNNYTINIKHVGTGGVLGGTEVRQAVSVASSNYRFELGASSGLDYPPTDTRPLGVFIRLENQRFLYTLAMPEDTPYYEELTAFLSEHYDGPARNLQRVNTIVSQLRASCPHLPFWEISST